MANGSVIPSEANESGRLDAINHLQSKVVSDDTGEYDSNPTCVHAMGEHEAKAPVRQEWESLNLSTPSQTQSQKSIYVGNLTNSSGLNTSHNIPTIVVSNDGAPSKRMMTDDGTPSEEVTKDDGTISGEVTTSAEVASGVEETERASVPGPNSGGVLTPSQSQQALHRPDVPYYRLRVTERESVPDPNSGGVLTPSQSQQALHRPDVPYYRLRVTERELVRGPNSGGVFTLSQSRKALQRPDVLYCLRVKEEGKTEREFYKDTPWKNINSGLSGSGHEDDSDEEPVITYYIDADIIDKTDKKPNTSKTWREDRTDFTLGQDAALIHRYYPALEIHSKKLIGVLEKILDYYPYRGFYDYYTCRLEDTFVEILYCYEELKEYLNTFLRSHTDEQSNPSFVIGSCGDEKYAERIGEYLDFGALNISKDPCDKSTAHDLAVLLRLLAPMYRAKVAPTMSTLLLSEDPMIKYETLWILFKPGTKVYVQESAFTDEDIDGNKDQTGGQKRSSRQRRGSRNSEFTACVVARWSYRKRDPKAWIPRDTIDRLDLELWNVQYDGTSFQRMARYARIVRFDQFKPVRELPVISTEHYDRFDGGALRKHLEKQGHQYLSIIREPTAHREYHDQDTGFEGQVIIDPESYRQYVGANSGIEIAPKIMADMYDLTERFLSSLLKSDMQDKEPLPAPSAIADGGGGRQFGYITNLKLESNDQRMLELQMLLPRKIEGFGLKTKTWMILKIDNISETAPMPIPDQLDTELVLVSDEDRDSLRIVLPKGESRITNTPDFVAGKGTGQIFLLYGPPGTGKTLTVECVANDTRRPLLSLTSRDIETLNEEESLRMWFTLAAKWDAILLIDEADLFLEQRTEGHLRRNVLSTIFLRTMEYYDGVLFLTTNRPGHIDDSFISRNTCPIAYHPLSEEAKKKVIKKFVKKFQETGTVIIEQAAERYLVGHCTGLNGRQLRNVLQDSVARAEVQYRASRRHAAEHGRPSELEDSHPVSVGMHHVKVAVERVAEFPEYLKALRGRDELARARNKHDYLSTTRTS